MRMSTFTYTDACEPRAKGGQEQASDPLELELDSWELLCGCF